MQLVTFYIGYDLNVLEKANKIENLKIMKLYFDK